MSDKNSTLTPDELRVLELRDLGFSYPKIGKKMGMAITTAQNLFNRGKAKLKPAELEDNFPALNESQGVRRLRELFEDAGGDEEKVFFSLCKEAQLPTSMIKMLRRRMTAGCLPTEYKPKSLDTKDFIDKMEDTAMRALHFMDDWTLANSNAKELSTVIDTMLTKSQLLKGEATSIITIDDRRKLHELMPAIVREAERRGQIIDVEVDEQSSQSG